MRCPVCNTETMLWKRERDDDGVKTIYRCRNHKCEACNEERDFVVKDGSPKK